MYLSLFFMFSVGCQSYKTALQSFCDSPYDCQGCDEGSIIVRQEKLRRHSLSKIQNAQARQFFSEISLMSPANGDAFLLKGLKEQGIHSCPVHESFAKLNIAAAEELKSWEKEDALRAGLDWTKKGNQSEILKSKSHSGKLSGGKSASTEGKDVGSAAVSPSVGPAAPAVAPN